jgi:hypothetical protein
MISGALTNTAGDSLLNWPFRLLSPDGNELSDADLAALGAHGQCEFNGGFWRSDGSGGYGFDGLDDTEAYKIDAVVPAGIFDPETMKLPQRRRS